MRELSAKPDGWISGRPNHYFHDGAGDPATCTEAHNHPEEGETYP